jgi:Zn ribbon nucleic-acid-binding protein
MIRCPKCDSQDVAQLRMVASVTFVNGVSKISFQAPKGFAVPRNIKLNYECVFCGYGWYASFKARSAAANQLGVQAVDQRKLRVDRCASKEERHDKVHKT